MLHRKAYLRGSLLAASLGLIAFSSARANTPTDSGSAVYALLFDQAEMWRERDRPDLAAQALQKIVASQPENAQAHFQLGLLYLQNQEFDKVLAIVAKLRRIAPSDPHADELERTVKFGPPDKLLLSEARRLNAAGAPEPAIAAYRRAFHGGPPPFDLALEYYETLAGIGSGWDEARLQLKELAERNGEVRRIRFVYARTLTYSEQTRREGIGILSDLCSDPAQAQSALEAMRQAMMWMDIGPADRGFYESYLKRFPNDSAIRDRLTRGSRSVSQDPLAQATGEAYRLTDAGEHEQAVARFEAIIQQNPANIDAIAGIGLVRLRQERFAESREQFLKAVALAPERKSDWATSLETANFWASYRDATAARDKGDIADAEKLARPLLERGGTRDRLVVQVFLGDVMRRLGKQKEAENFLREALRLDPTNQEALLGLAQILASQGREIGKEPLLANLNKNIQSRLELDSVQRNTERLRTQAKSAERSSPQQAEGLFQQAMRLDPANVWIRYDYAKFVLRQGRSAEAVALIDVLATSERAESLFAAAVYNSEQQRSGEALALLDRIPLNQRSARMNALRRDLASAGESDQLIAAAKAGDTTARATLIARSNSPQSTPGQIAGSALALAKAGLRPQAMATLQKVLSRTDLTTDILRQLFFAASELGEEQQASNILARMSRTASGQDFAGLREGLAIRQADRLREQNNAGAAYDILSPYVSGASPSVAARLSLARIYRTSKYGDEAIQVLDGIMASSPADPATLQEAVGIAIELRRYDRAQNWLSEALRTQPLNARLHVVQSRLLRAKGDNAGARRALERAQELNTDPQSAAGPPAKFEFNGDRRTEIAPVGGAKSHLAAASPGIVADGCSAEESMKDARAEATGVVACSDDTAQASPSDRSASGRYEAVPLRRPGASQSEASVAPSAPTGASDPLGREIERELIALKQQTAPSGEAGLQLRVRSGEAGLGRLAEISLPLLGSFPLGTGKFNAYLTPVALSTGAASTDASTLGRYGTNQLQPLGGGRAPINADAAGAGVGVGFDWGIVHADIGSSPLGFQITNVLGGIFLKIPVGPSATVKVEGSRRAVTDSLLSYAGVQDPITRTLWGGVTRMASDNVLSFDDGDIGAYGKFAYARYDGSNVPTNTSYEVTAGAYFRPIKDETSELKVGVSATYLSYAQNLGQFSFGQGGYFSPQSFSGLSVPVDWTEKSGRFKYLVGGTLGVQSIQKSRSAYFPNNPGMQAAADAISAGDSTRPSNYDATSLVGLAYSLRGGLEYAMSDRLGVGALVDFDSSKEFDQGKVMFFLRTTFN